MSKETPLPNPRDNAKPLNYREQFQGREVTSRFIDPCEAAAKASLACMNKNDYDREQCLEYFQAYRDCKSAWLEQRKDDRRNGRPSS
ncbi:hypothetical protein BT96DRAFT_1023659 [Gymnopus androsaceus JB14]|uniref:CHCH domain-containing protein n=1 Tax=Gymnopus androsaceus JB14 TaxID=1447944 RepID=A0A6A4H3E0_9AGAR|nr:hypothetical protein BT96DRAFT_1023659 [Gymnopus androsaceus JB14]